jgi:Plasmid encoded RepA protein
MAQNESRQAKQELTTVKRRLLAIAAEIEESGELSILYQHTVFCQTCLPYRDPGDVVRTWERLNGEAGLQVNAGTAWHPQEFRFVPLGLPFGPKPRLILAHLNAEALRTRSPMIEVEDSLTAFVKRLHLDTKGRNVRAIKDQLSRLSAASIRLGLARNGRAITINSNIVGAFELWFPKDERQRVLWPSTVQLSQEYFESLLSHAVPLDERALAALSHSAMALDIYAWLAQRLHRITLGQKAFISWPALQSQFGWHYMRLRDFRRVFREALVQVLSQYRGARLDLGEGGMSLWASPPPVKGRTAIVICQP